MPSLCVFLCLFNKCTSLDPLRRDTHGTERGSQRGWAGRRHAPSLEILLEPRPDSFLLGTHLSLATGRAISNLARN